MPLVFLGCLTIFGCLFVFKVDGLIGGGQHRFPLLGPDGQASKTSSELEGQSLGGREGELWPPPVPEAAL